MKLLRDPLVHFLILGAALFLAYGLVGNAVSPDANRRIRVTASEIEVLAGNWERQWLRPPTEQELNGMVKARVREEILYREALGMGLDENDAVVRRRLVQKVELLSQDLALLTDPTDAELRSYFAEHRDDYRIPPRLSFSHVYFNVDQRGAEAERDARRLLAELRETPVPPEQAAERGDRFMLQYAFSLQTPLEVRQLFGKEFSEQLFELEPGWQGPVGSGYGLHLVHVGERVPTRIPDYEEVRDRLVLDFNRMRRDRANEALFESLAGAYRIEIDEDAVKRLARGDPSAGETASR